MAWLSVRGTAREDLYSSILTYLL